MYSKLLKDEDNNLSGKPDYIYARFLTGRPMIVEVKSGEIGSAQIPHYGDLMQLVAYFFIARAVFGRKPKKGWLVYRDWMFVVKNTKKLRKEFLNVLDEMAQMLETGEGEADPSFVKCRYCVCKGTVCEYQSQE